GVADDNRQEGHEDRAEDRPQDGAEPADDDHRQVVDRDADLELLVVGDAEEVRVEHDIAAEIIGINIFRYKLLAFAISSFYAGVTGVLYTYFLGIANYEQFQIGVSIDYLAMIIIGGLGSVLGSIFGAIFVTLLPIVIRYAMEAFGGIFFAPQTVLNL